ncbi:MAG TPA: MMPL family transporter [Acidimicrobiales bacterium]
MFAALGRVVINNPWKVIAAWVVAAVIVLAFSPQIASVTSNNNANFLPPGYQSIDAQNVANKYFPQQSGATGSLVISTAKNNALSQQNKSTIQGLVTSLTNDHIPSVSAIQTSPQTFPSGGLAPNGKVLLINVLFKGQPGDTGVNQAVKIVRDDSTAFLKNTGLVSGLTGNAAISVDTTNAYSSAEQIIAIATLVLILALLGFVFRSPIIAIMPIVVIGVVHQMAQSLTADLAKAFNFQVGSELAPLLVVVMFGIGTDYIVFMLFRYRERLVKNKGEPTEKGLNEALTVIGVVIASAAGTVAAAFAALLLSSLGSLRTLAPGLIIGVLLMAIAALTLVPAIFKLLGIHLFWPSKPKVPQGPSRSVRIADAVARRPGRVAAAFAGILIVISVGATGFKPTYNTLAELPSSTLSQQAFNTMGSAFPPGVLGPTQIYVTSASGPIDQAGLTSMVTKLQSTQGVAQNGVFPPQLTANNSVALVQVLLNQNPYSTPAMNDVQGPIRSAAHGSVPGSQVLVGGTTSSLVDVRTALGHSMTIVFPVAIFIIFCILALILRAVVAPLWLLAGVGLTFLATIGAITLVFINGTGYPGIDFSIPIVVYLFVVAIGTDYNILMSTRLREEFNNGREPHDAVHESVLHNAPTISTAGLILAGTFASLLLTGIQSLQEIGFGVAIGVIIAANVLSTRLVPAIAALRGWRFWWPHQRQQQTAPSVKDLVQLTPVDVSKAKKAPEQAETGGTSSPGSS